LVIARRPVFGTVQIERAEAMDESQLIWLNVVVNQLAIALDRHVALRREVAARERAELLERQATDLVKREQAALSEARRAIRVRDLFLAVVSHDLRDLVGATSVAVGNLLRAGEAFSGTTDGRRRLDILKRSVESMKT